MKKLYVEVIGSRYAFGLTEMQKSISQHMEEKGYRLVATLEETDLGLFVLPMRSQSHSFEWLRHIEGEKCLIGIYGSPLEIEDTFGYDSYKKGRRAAACFGGPQVLVEDIIIYTGDWFERAVAKCAHQIFKNLNPHV